MLLSLFHMIFVMSLESYRHNTNRYSPSNVQGTETNCTCTTVSLSVWMQHHNLKTYLLFGIKSNCSRRWRLQSVIKHLDRWSNISKWTWCLRASRYIVNRNKFFLYDMYHLLFDFDVRVATNFQVGDRE
jgi:hypothetical protein